MPSRFAAVTNKEISPLIKQAVPEIHEEGDEVRGGSFKWEITISFKWEINTLRRLKMLFQRPYISKSPGGACLRTPLAAHAFGARDYEGEKRKGDDHGRSVIARQNCNRCRQQ